MTNPILTIAIPTYARPQHLKNLVDGLLPQIDERVRLVVVDNCSPVPARDILPPEVEVIRNPVNVGAAGNFPRCFELATTDWFWIIGDDDLVDPDAIARVLAAIAQYPDAAVLNFVGHNRIDRHGNVSILEGFSEFLAGNDSISMSIWMSGNIYARKYYWPHLNMAYRFANTNSSHYVLLMMVLLSGGSYVQLPDPVCRQSENDFEGSGNLSELIRSVMALAELPMSRKQQREFARQLQQGFVNFRRDLFYCSYHADAVGTEERREILHLFLQRWLNWALIRGSFGQFVLAGFGRLLLGTAAGRASVKLSGKIRGKLTGHHLPEPQCHSRFYRQT